MLGCASTNAKTAIRDLQEEGFTDIHVFPTKEKVWPYFFVDKYTYIESNNDGEIYLRDIITGRKKVLLSIKSWNPKEDCIDVLSLKDNIMYFLIQHPRTIEIYKYMIETKITELMRNIDFNKEISVHFSYFDEKNKKVYVELWDDENIYCYDLLSNSQYTNKQPDYKELDNLYPITIFNLDTGQKELYYVEGYNNYFYCLPEYAKVKIEEGQYLTVNRCKRLVSELCILDFKTNSSRLFRLKDFNYEITGLYQVDEYEYCFIVCCQNKSTVLCYFTKDILESQ